MRININQLIYDYNTQRGKIRGVSPLKECLTKAKLARILVERDKCGSFNSALMLLERFNKEVQKTVDIKKLMPFLCEFFDKTVDEILTD